MTEAKSIQRLIIVLVTVILGATTSTLLQVFVLREEAPLYQSIGKLIVKSPMSQNVSGELWQNQAKDYYGSIIETLESAEIKRRAMDSARVSNPEIRACEVQVQVSHLKNGGAFNVITTGSEPRYTSIFLDAMLDEFIAFQAATKGRFSEGPDAIVIQAHASPAVEVLGDWQETAFSGAITGGVAGLIAGLLLALTLVRPEKEIPSSLPSMQLSPATTMRKWNLSIITNNRLLIWGLVFGIALSLLIQILRLTSRPQEFRSLAKVVAAQGLDPEKISTRPINDDYYGTIIETLESSQLNSAAMKRVKIQNPEVTDHDVDVRVAQTKGSAIFNVLATGSEPKYTRAFLDALLDEFMILRTRQAEDAGRDPRKDIVIQERAIPAYENIEDWSMPLTAGSVNGALIGGLLGFFAKLFSQRQKPLPEAELAS
ncbi:MAG: hypothetical protein K9N47_11375 [Prosthecobacter sp.]|uniref:hypothetical protein n=1 Tax=Prosthecobacter sp. TaxID=1965333 RepID=UPI0025EF182D|nr:hypothetical protein [Prosthecobacter sp.]MCF7786715.1 hypothetical protein [Prosthecobacter sp.]